MLNAFDQMFGQAVDLAGTGNYPPFNLIQEDDDTYVIEMAVAGFSEDQISVSVEDRRLRIEGNGSEKTETDAGRAYIYRGLAERAFRRDFKLGAHVEVTGAELRNGLLTIRLAREIPEAAKPRLIPINRN